MNPNIEDFIEASIYWYVSIVESFMEYDLMDHTSLTISQRLTVYMPVLSCTGLVRHSLTQRWVSLCLTSIQAHTCYLYNLSQ